MIILAVKSGRRHTPNVNSSKTIRVAQSVIRFRERVFREENMQEDVLFDAPLYRSPSPARGAPV